MYLTTMMDLAEEIEGVGYRCQNRHFPFTVAQQF
jgi:hypothetical protein